MPKGQVYPVGPCGGCHRVMRLRARGLCRRCYGRPDAFVHPKRRPGRPPAPARNAVPVRDGLVLGHLNLVSQVVCAHLGDPGVRRLGVDDAAGEGTLALLRAAELFPGGDFRAYAYTAVKRAVWAAAAALGRQPMPLSDLVNDEAHRDFLDGLPEG